MRKKVFHILVKHQYEAEDLVKKLQSGGDFSELARKFSICSSAASGGDLGELNPKRFIQEFTEAAELLKIGEISKPVRTRFGYHLIKVVES